MPQIEGDMLKIGRQMRKFRTARGVTHRELALACGVTEGTISRIETNKAEAMASTMAAIADYLGVTMDELRDEPKAAAGGGPSELERQLIDAARRVQDGDRSALADMRRLTLALAESESNAGTEAKKTPARRKGT